MGLIELNLNGRAESRWKAHQLFAVESGHACSNFGQFSHFKVNLVVQSGKLGEGMGWHGIEHAHIFECYPFSSRSNHAANANVVFECTGLTRQRPVAKLTGEWGTPPLTP